MAEHRRVTAAIRGAGYSSATGGFTRLTINGAAHHPDDVSRAVAALPSAVAALHLVCETIDRPPDPNCSCHIYPPCGDCTEYGALRIMFEAIDEAIAAATPPTQKDDPDAS